MRKLTCILLSLLLLPVFPVSADTDAIIGVFDDLSNMVRITGNAGETYAGQIISLLVTWKGADISSLSGMDIIYVTETVADEEGKYIFLFPWDPKKGDVEDCKFDLYVAGKNLSYTVETVEEVPSEWNAVKNMPLFFSKGSAIDLSFMNHAPAGKYGFVKVDDDGDFYFENKPGEKVRFYGANLTQAGVVNPTHKQAEIIARQCAVLGYNIVRLHHFDMVASNRQTSRSIFLPPTSTEIELDEERLDRMEYLIYCLKQEGIYITLDILKSYPLQNIPSLSSYGLDGCKLLTFFSDAREAWKSMARKFLSHVNPYTGLALKDDPVLVSISPWNEGMFLDGTMDISNPTLREHILQDFNTYLVNKGKSTVTSEQLGTTIWNASAAIREDLLEYYYAKTVEAYMELSHYLKNDLGVRVPISGMNLHAGALYTLLKDECADIMDVHKYNGLIAGNSEYSTIIYTPGTHQRLSRALTEKAKEEYVPQYSNTVLTQYIPSLALRQLLNKPYAITEFNQPFPTKGREEIGIFVGALGAYNGWDMLNRFEFAGNYDRKSKNGYEHVEREYAPGGLYAQIGGGGLIGLDDPLTIYSELQAALMFRKGCLTEAWPQFVIVRDRAEAKRNTGSMSAKQDQSLIYLVHMFKTVTVFRDSPETPFAVYKITPDLTRQQILSGNIPETNRVTLPGLSTDPSTENLIETARAFINALDDQELKEKMLAGLAQGKLISDTGELVYDINRTSYSVNSSNVAAVAGTLDGNTFHLGNTVIECDSETGAVMAASLDDNALENSKRILITYITDAAATGENYFPDSQDPQKMIYTIGTLPTLIKYGTGRFTLKTSRDPESYAAFKLDMLGNRVERLNVEINDGQITVPLETDKGFAFELISYDSNEMISGKLINATYSLDQNMLIDVEIIPSTFLPCDKKEYPIIIRENRCWKKTFFWDDYLRPL